MQGFNILDEKEIGYKNVADGESSSSEEGEESDDEDSTEMKETIMKNAGLESIFSEKINLDDDARGIKGM